MTPETFSFLQHVVRKTPIRAYLIIILCLLANITPVDKCPRFVIPAQAGIKQSTGCRTKSGMTALAFESPG